MLKVLSDAYVAADAGKVTLLGLLDLSAAFDTADHQILVERLRRTFSVDGSSLDWVISYLTVVARSLLVAASPGACDAFVIVDHHRFSLVSLFVR